MVSTISIDKINMSVQSVEPTHTSKVDNGCYFDSQIDNHTHVQAFSLWKFNANYTNYIRDNQLATKCPTKADLIKYKQNKMTQPRHYQLQSTSSLVKKWTREIE